MSDQLLTVAIRTGPPTVTVLTADGEIDHDSRKVLDAAATQALDGGRVRLVLDLTGVTFCDSGGLSMFVDIHRRCAAAGGWLRLAGTQGMVIGVVRATNLDRLLALYDDVDAATTDLAVGP